jgi:uncharacterized membrane protein
MATRPDDIFLVRVTTDDGAHQLWFAAAASQEEALALVLNAVPEGWTASLVSSKLTPTEIEILNLKEGEVRELTLNRVTPAPRTN